MSVALPPPDNDEDDKIDASPIFYIVSVLILLALISVLWPTCIIWAVNILFGTDLVVTAKSCIAIWVIQIALILRPPY